MTVGLVSIYVEELASRFHLVALQLRIELKFLHGQKVNRGRIAQAALGEFNNLFGDELRYRVAALGQPQRVTSIRERDAHRFNQFRIEGLPP
jgi:hypothetical protein